MTYPVDLKWPYPIEYGNEAEVEADVLVLGGGIAGCWAAIAAAKDGAKVAIVEKGAVLGSGAGISCDHWQWAITDVPGVKITAEEFTNALMDNHGGYNNGITRYIQAREGYETLLELEEMGGKIRDTEDEFKGAPFRDEKSKFLFAYDYENNLVMRVWGITFKAALYKQLKKLGVKIYDRVMATGLLTKDGKQGEKVIGATGVNTRTGQFYIFKSKATVLCGARPQCIWTYATEYAGLTGARSPSSLGAAYALAWRAGAEFGMMERAIQLGNFTSISPAHGSGHNSNTWYPCNMVDAEGKKIPWVDRDGNVIEDIKDRSRPAPGQKFFLMGGGSSALPHPGILEYKGPRLKNVDEQLAAGEVSLPLYADLPSMSAHERRAIFGLMVGQEAKTKYTYVNYTKAGFDPDKDLLMSNQQLVGGGGYGTSSSGAKMVVGYPYVRNFSSGVVGGPMIDWNLRTTLEGLYAAGDGIMGGNDHGHAATTGRYAGKQAGKYVKDEKQVDVNRSQIDEEKARVYAPLKRSEGIGWKELLAGINKAMQMYCGDIKRDRLLNMGLMSLEDIKDVIESDIYADDPHSLTNILGIIDIHTAAEMIIHASLARKASSAFLHFKRAEYPETDPADWNKFVTITSTDGSVKVGERPFGYWGDIVKNYEVNRI
ncbi:MAG: FAD-dependent oxidoreductase [Chloroflexi bacterium]|jgi:succinate dehydrogenase/fumarate reductase flavoprotein subunit|nr:FAD-dependent oxidoreductase [Chloroflexota bacterium]MBT7082529.1 FAD-dependent oxidoreductase [Chloroflexota bacterium]